MRVATGLMLGLVLLAAGAARAEMTEADEAGMRAFAACVEAAGGDEGACLGKLGRYAWYPKDGAVCETVGARVHKAISDGAQAEWQDLFFNERCARVGLPHDREAAKAGDRLDPDREYGKCMDEIKKPFECDRTLGRHSHHPWADGECEISRQLESVYDELGWTPAWQDLFSGERCRRLGMPYFEPEP